MESQEEEDEDDDEDEEEEEEEEGGEDEQRDTMLQNCFSAIVDTLAHQNPTMISEVNLFTYRQWWIVKRHFLVTICNNVL